MDKDTHGSVNTQIINNILINNEGFGLYLIYAPGRTDNMTIDHNLYFKNGWRSWENGGVWHAGVMGIQEGDSWTAYQTLAEAKAHTPWEVNGEEGNPQLILYNPADHDLYDSSWPDFHLTSASTYAIDKGTITIPDSLSALLDEFSVMDYRVGSAYDIGRFEIGNFLLASPVYQAIEPGSTCYYKIKLFPSDLTYDVSLSIENPSPYLQIELSPSVISGAQVATLKVVDSHPIPMMPGESIILTITGVGNGSTLSANMNLLVGGSRVYLPITRR